MIPNTFQQPCLITVCDVANVNSKVPLRSRGGSSSALGKASEVGGRGQGPRAGPVVQAVVCVAEAHVGREQHARGAVALSEK